VPVLGAGSHRQLVPIAFLGQSGRELVSSLARGKQSGLLVGGSGSWV